jgi:Secretion system C-terminal sorting domain/Photosynthesis system II assembly factor YCF48
LEEKMKKFSIFVGAILVVMTFGANIFAQPAWTPQTSPTTQNLNSASAVSTDLCWMSGESGAVIRTTNGGTTWTLVNAGLAGLNFYNLFAIDANECWLGQDDGTLWHTTNGGANWTFIVLSPTPIFINIIHFFDANYGFIQGDPVGNQWRYYITTDGGLNWTLPPNTPNSVGTEAGWNNSYCALDTGHIWWGTNATKIWKGSLRGPFSSYPSGSANYSFGVAFDDANTGVALVNTSGTTNQPCLRSTNGGTSWASMGFTPAGIAYGIKAVPGTGYMWISATTGIARSTNSGTSFTNQFTLPANQAGFCISMANINCGWVGTQAGHIYKYTDNVGIGTPITTPTKFELKQNYPNPFNPQTTIYFSLAQTGYVTLKIYNMLGQSVMTLIDGVETAGEHYTTFNASNLPSGTYFYTMKSGDFTETRSMVLVK